MTLKYVTWMKKTQVNSPIMWTKWLELEAIVLSILFSFCLSTNWQGKFPLVDLQMIFEIVFLSISN